MGQILLKLLVAAIVVGLMLMSVRDFYLGHVPGVRSGFSVRYARRDETPVLFWLFTVARAAILGLVAVLLVRQA